MICPNCQQKFEYYRLKMNGEDISADGFVCPHCDSNLKFEDKNTHVLYSYLIISGSLSLFFLLDKFTFLGDIGRDNFWIVVKYFVLFSVFIVVIVALNEKRRPVISDGKIEVVPMSLPEEESDVDEPFNSANKKPSGTKRILRVIISLVLVAIFIVPSALKILDLSRTKIKGDNEIKKMIVEEKGQMIIRNLELMRSYQGKGYPVTLSKEMTDSSFGLFAEDIEKMEKDQFGKVLSIDDFSYQSNGKTYKLCIDPIIMTKCWQGGIEKEEVSQVDGKSEERESKVYPIKDSSLRITKKPFGKYIDSATSPVQPEKFEGYHTGVDFEVFPGEINAEVEVYSVCDGSVLQKMNVTGYGGVVILGCEVDKKYVTILYGHLDLKSLEINVGDVLNKGEAIGYLGDDKSEETSFERKHLHLGVHLGSEINVLGYVGSEKMLSNWIDPCLYFCELK